MSTIKISQLPLTTTVCNTALIPIVQDGLTCATYACKLGSTVLVEGSGTFSVQRNGCSNAATGLNSLVAQGVSNSASGAYSLVTQGLANKAGNCFTTANGTNNIVCVSNSHVLSGQMNVIACDARPNFSTIDNRLNCPVNSGSGGYYNGFVAGQTTLSSTYGDLTSYYTPGSTVSSIYVYSDPQLVYTNLVVCGSSYNAGTCETTICVDPSINTCSGYLIKTSTFSSYSAYHPNIIAGGAFNTINDYTSASTISGGYNNTVSGGYSTIGGGYYNEIRSASGGFISGGLYNGILNGNYSSIGGGSFNLIGGNFSANSVIGGGNCNTLNGPYSFIGSGFSNTVCTNGSSIVGGVQNSISNTTSTAFIGGGENNTVSGYSSAILGGVCNTAGCNCAFIVGSNITADRACTTFVNNLSIKNIPTAAAGLPSGSVWSNSGILTIVP
jgi:hypothetical protein